MSNRNGAKGTQFESSLIPLLSEYMPQTHRLGKQGVKDKGDFWTVDPRYVIEAKNVARLNLAGWIAEAEVEAVNAGKPYGIVVLKRKGVADPSKQYVITTLGTFLRLAHGEPNGH